MHIIKLIFITLIAIQSHLGFSHTSLTRNLRKVELRNPTWVELKDLLSDDQTDKEVYNAEKFNCAFFALMLRDAIRDQGLRSAYVNVEYVNQNTGHALNAFETDQGLVFIEPQSDHVIYLEIGKAYAVLPIQALQEEITDISGPVEEFFNPLRKVRYSRSLFEYAYYENYLARKNYYQETLEKHNEAVKNINAQNQEINDAIDKLNLEVDRYNNQDPERLSDQDLKEEEERILVAQKILLTRKAEIEVWSANINSLLNELHILIKHDEKIVERFNLFW